MYGFVRFADEIVDTFHDYDKVTLFHRFVEDTHRAIEERISLNPILNSFQWAFHAYNMDIAHVDKFLESMERDLDQTAYDRDGYDDYIVGSAEVVGLMCLSVFVKGNAEEYERLLPHARSLGAAFQKINFLRDLQADWEGLGRTYFPGLDLLAFDAEAKRNIEAEIEADFTHAHEGILQLPHSARLGVYMATSTTCACSGKSAASTIGFSRSASASRTGKRSPCSWGPTCATSSTSSDHGPSRVGHAVLRLAGRSGCPSPFGQAALHPLRMDRLPRPQHFGAGRGNGEAGPDRLDRSHRSVRTAHRGTPLGLPCPQCRFRVESPTKFSRLNTGLDQLDALVEAHPEDDVLRALRLSITGTAPRWLRLDQDWPEDLSALRRLLAMDHWAESPKFSAWMSNLAEQIEQERT